MLLVDLMRDLSSEDVETRRGAVQALLVLRSRESVPALIIGLKDEDTEVRLMSAGILGMIGPEARAAIPALTAALKDPVWSVRVIGSDALVAICGEGCLEDSEDRHGRFEP